MAEQCALAFPFFGMLDWEDIRQESPYFADDLLGGLECADRLHRLILIY